MDRVIVRIPAIGFLDVPECRFFRIIRTTGAAAKPLFHMSVRVHSTEHTDNVFPYGGLVTFARRARVSLDRVQTVRRRANVATAAVRVKGTVATRSKGNDKKKKKVVDPAGRKHARAQQRARSRAGNEPGRTGVNVKNNIVQSSRRNVLELHRAR